MIVRIVLLFPLLLSLVGANCWPSLPPLTFVVAGQSNAMGSSAQPFLIPTHPNLGKVITWKYTIENIIDPVYPQTVEATPWPSFSETWASTLGRKVQILQAAVGGICLTSLGTLPNEPQWDPDGDGVTSGARYVGMIDRAIYYSSVSDYRAVLWYQGECEVGHTTFPTGNKYDDYYNALIYLADRIHEDLGIPMIAAEISMKTNTVGCAGGTLNHQAIHDAIHDAAAASPYILDTVVETDDILFVAPDCTHHYDVVTLGQRFFDAIHAEGLDR